MRDIVSARSRADLDVAIADQPLNYEPPTDENPYFFNMLKLTHLGAIRLGGAGVLRGNLIATLTLVALIFSLGVLTIATIVVPLAIRSRSQPSASRAPAVLWYGAVYFSLIGAGFMLVEIGLIQRLSVFLSHPVYALGILLFTIILSSGVGSYLSEQLPLTRPPWIFVYPMGTAMGILAIRFVLPEVLSNMVASPMLSRVAVSVGLIFPLGLLLGGFFPTGMRLARQLLVAETPWFWALNGIFGVLCSALAVFFSIYVATSLNFYIGAACYAAISVCLFQMYRASRIRPQYEHHRP